MESTLKAFLQDGGFVHRDHGLYFNICVLCENQIKFSHIIYALARISNSEEYTERQANGSYTRLHKGELHYYSNDLRQEFTIEIGDYIRYISVDF